MPARSHLAGRMFFVINKIYAFDRLPECLAKLARRIITPLIGQFVIFYFILGTCFDSSLRHKSRTIYSFE